ncbi:helix-turn-helix domain-containing protein [Sinomonas sp. JGH33]|uniref:Helix-turn-helix domain-containing protein n=1 Tax=Sinomonas terricola TaxID=3110330 RepID=A0ABU5T8F9_9MICC|nr:helix-turn-helix domain-containing protein [Sinomonas sp. JGH33]MEA5455804.1 helix-turn-helix domain-containing protein [Sinomonas sp. JGH33]
MDGRFVNRPTSRGQLTPDPRAPLARLNPPAWAAHAIRHFWVVEWSLPDGEQSRQLVLGYPVLNFVAEPDRLAIYGPTTAAGTRVLEGTGWAVGALLRPAATPLFTDRPARFANAERDVEAPELHCAVVRAMTRAAPAESRFAEATHAVARWIAERLPEAGARGLEANRLADLADSEPGLLRVPDLAAAMGASERTLGRLAADFLGPTPAAIMRRRRIQLAAERLRADPATPLAGLAQDLGYADQPHLTRDFRAVLGVTPREYAQMAAPAPPTAVS